MAKDVSPLWIPVSERLPADKTNVLVHTGQMDECVFTAERKPGQNGWFCWRSGREIHGVTHWTAIPQAPK